MFGDKLADKAGCTPDDDIELLRGGCHELGVLCEPTTQLLGLSADHIVTITRIGVNSIQPNPVDRCCYAVLPLTTEYALSTVLFVHPL